MKIEKINFNNKKGVSIIEILIYLSIFSFISIIVIKSMIISFSAFSYINTNHKIINSGNNSMNRISQEIRQAKTIDLTSTSQTLILNSIDNAGNTVLTKIAKEGEYLNLYKDDILIGSLLNNNIIVNYLDFKYITNSKGKSVKIMFTIQNINNKKIKVENFYNTVILRNSY